MHEVLLRVWKRADTAPIDNLTAYAFQTAGSVLADWHRRRNVRHVASHVEFDVECHAASDVDAGRICEDRESLRAATTAIAELSPRTRTVFVLRRLEGLTYRDIADHLGISVSATEKHMVRAVKKLAECALVFN